MRCSKCTTENKDFAAYCKKCGSPLGETDVHRNRKKPFFMIIIALLIAAACAASITLYLNSRKAANYNGQLDTAGKYLQKMDYDRAEAEYLKAIEIQPKKEEAYLELSDLYTQKGEYDKALTILQKGKKESKGQKIEPKLQSLEEKFQETSYESILSQYRELIEQDFYRDLQDDFDGSQINGDVNLELVLAARNSEAFQVYYALKDIDKNGTAELLIGAGGDSDSIGFYDIYTLSKEQPKHLFEDYLFGYRTNFCVYEDGVIEIVGAGSAIDHSCEYYKLDGDNPKLFDQISVFADYDEEIKTIRYFHGKEGEQEISETEFEEIKEKYASKQEMSFEWKVLQEESDFNQVLQNTEDTLKQLQ